MEKISGYILGIVLLCPYPFQHSVAAEKSETTEITVSYTNSNINDTLYLFITNDLHVSNNVSRYKIKAGLDSTGKFSFLIPDQFNYGYLEIGKEKTQIVKDVSNIEQVFPISFFEKGDQISLFITKSENIPIYEFDFYKRFRYGFTGKGSEKWKLYMEADSIMKLKENGKNANSVVSENKEGYLFNDPGEEGSDAAIDYLSEHRDEISSLAYNVYVADIIHRGSLSKFLIIEDYYRDSVLTKDSPAIENFKTAYKVFFEDMENKYHLPQEGLNISRVYLNYLYNKNQTDCFLFKGASSPDICFNKILSDYDGEIRDRLLLKQLIYGHNSVSFNQQFSIAEKVVTTDYCKSELRELKSRMGGAKAFNFSLPAKDGKIVKLSDFKGKVVVLDFWFTGCGGCQVMYENVLSKAKHFYDKKEDVAFLTISVDRDISRWAESINSGQYTSKDAVNLYTAGDGYHHEVIRHYKVQYYPTVVLINKEGNISLFNFIQVNDPPEILVNRIKELL